MKRAKPLRSLEELWKLEDRHPLLDASGAGLMRWMLATGVLANPPSKHRMTARRKTHASRGNGNGHS